MLIGVLAQIGNFEVIAQEIITIEFYERVQVEQRLNTQRGGHHQGEIIRQRGGVSESPEERGQRPAENLKPGSSERYQEALAFLWEKPGIAHVAIHGRLEVNQE